MARVRNKGEQTEMIVGKVVLNCPLKRKELNREVTLHKDCIGCPHFKHWGWRGAHPIITCKIEEKLTKIEAKMKSDGT